MKPAELEAGIARNNARAMDPGGWRLRWIFNQLVPTGTFFSFFFQVPPAAAVFRLEYLIVGWPTGDENFRNLFVELLDDQGEKFIFVDSRKTATSRGAKFTLFTTPGTNTDGGASDRAVPLGVMPLNMEFPGRSTLQVNIRGAIITPGTSPAVVNVLMVGHQRNII